MHGGPPSEGLQQNPSRAGLHGDGFRTVTPNELRADFTPYPSSGYRGVFEGTGVRIETEDGRVVQRRENAREVCVSHKFRWDDLDLLYFKGYAQWSYLTEPFYLLMPGFEFREAEPGREGTETWRKLDVIFPSGFPTHSRAQSFYFDEKGDLRRHDYFADVFGSIRRQRTEDRGDSSPSSGSIWKPSRW